MQAVSAPAAIETKCRLLDTLHWALLGSRPSPAKNDVAFHERITKGRPSRPTRSRSVAWGLGYLCKVGVPINSRNAVWASAGMFGLRDDLLERRLRAGVVPTECRQHPNGR